MANDTQTSQPQLFTRNATGLVRELSAFDAFNLVFSAVLIPVGITQVMGFAPQFWPHANMLVAFAFATPLVACFGLVYLYFTALMPRSGGDYVWVSRTLHPALGFIVNFSLTFVFLTGWRSTSPSCCRSCCPRSVTSRGSRASGSTNRRTAR